MSYSDGLLLQVLHKSSASAADSRHRRRNIVPTYCPFMTKLHRFYETDSAIYLVLHHAPGGKLWNYLSRYLSQSQRTEDRDVLSKDTVNYVGKTVHVPDDGATAAVAGASNSGTAATADVADSGKDHIKPCIANSSSSNKSSANVDKSELYQCERDSEAAVTCDTTCVQSKLSNETVHAAADGVSHAHADFRDMLANMSETPVNRNFSVDSTDSDSELKPDAMGVTGSASRVEPITEVSETSTPVGTPVKTSKPAAVNKQSSDDVFHSDAVATSTPVRDAAHAYGRGESVTRMLSSTERFVSEIESELRKSDDEFRRLLLDDSRDAQLRQNVADMERCSLGANTATTERSIYDDDSPSPVSSDNGSSPPNVVASSSCKDNSEHQVTSSGDTAASAKCHRQGVMKRLSQERSPEASRKQRSRTNTGSSSLFADLGLADDDEKTPLARIPERLVRRWAAELVRALEHLHTLGHVWRDLTPDNLLLGQRGHLQLTYCSQWSAVDGGVKPEALEQQYCAPGKHLAYV